jgi:hypothetical protein
MESLHSRYPQDSEAAIFYALSLIANASLKDKTYANQKKATLILAPIILQQPQHPGIAHYIIHADDNPVLAPLALDAAKQYSQIAPDSPHALHMPSHIFTRVGLWDDSIASNLASAASARKQKMAGDELHALDYLIYAYLQSGRITEARKMTQQLPDIEPGDPQDYTQQLRYRPGTGLSVSSGALPRPYPCLRKPLQGTHMRRLFISPARLARQGLGTSRRRRRQCNHCFPCATHSRRAATAMRIGWMFN